MDILIYVGIGLAAVIGLVLLCATFYKVANIDKVLIVTGWGCKEPKLVVSGGSFVIPVFQKADYFDLCMRTIDARNDQILTKQAVPIIVNWTAQIRPEVDDMKLLTKAIRAFKERGHEAVIEDVQKTLTGAVRNVVASMTPEEVLREKDTFESKVKTMVKDEMLNMGLELVSLTTLEVTDENGYFRDIATVDMEDKRLSAESKKADTNREIRKKAANANQEAAQTELAAELAIQERKRDNMLKQADFKAETDTALANAEVAGILQKTIREQEVEEQKGKIEVVKQEQANLAAQKHADVIATQAEAEKRRANIEAEKKATVMNIEAEARVKVSERNAEAIRIDADANADKVLKAGNAEAEVVKKQGIANAEVVRQQGLAAAEVEKEQGLAKVAVEKAQGLADAEIVRQKGLADAEAIEAKLMAEAKGQRELAEALASHDKVNFEIEKLKIETQAQVQVATQTAQIMANLGQNAEFINFGGAMQGAGATGNVLFDAMSGIPGMMKMLNAQNRALNGQSFNDEVNGLVKAVAEPVKGVLSYSEGDTSVVKTDAVDADM